MPTLKLVLEEIALMGEKYVLSESGYDWKATQLLRWLQEHFPTDLKLRVQFIRPGLTDEGAIYEVDQDGELLSSMPLYWVERSLPSQLTIDHPTILHGQLPEIGDLAT